MKWVWWMIWGLFWLAACSPRPSEPGVSIRVRSVAVLPFEAACPGGESGFFACPTKEVLKGPIAPGAPEIMDTLLRERLAGRAGFRFVSRERWEALWEEILAQNPNPTPGEVVRRWAKLLGVEALLYGKVFRFREREGKGYAVKTPASVAFVLVLFDGRTGRIIWKGYFDETQKPLSENVLNLRLYGGVRWLTARELAARGLKKVLKDFPYPEG